MDSIELESATVGYEHCRYLAFDSQKRIAYFGLGDEVITIEYRYLQPTLVTEDQLIETLRAHGQTQRRTRQTTLHVK